MIHHDDKAKVLKQKEEPGGRLRPYENNNRQRLLRAEHKLKEDHTENHR